MPEPVFSEADRVTVNNNLPAELKGVTDPAKIAAYYQRREGELREQLRAAPPQQRSSVVIEQRTDDKDKPITQAEAEGARSTLIEAAKTQAAVGKPYWDRLRADIDKLMEPLAPEDKVNFKVWETCYYTLLGMNKTKFDEEDRVKAAEATRLAAERSSAPPAAQEAPAPLPVEVTSKVLPGLGISEKSYRDAQDHISAGRWPLTAENIGGRRTTIGSEK